MKEVRNTNANYSYQLKREKNTRAMKVPDGNVLVSFNNCFNVCYNFQPSWFNDINAFFMISMQTNFHFLSFHGCLSFKNASVLLVQTIMLINDLITQCC